MIGRALTAVLIMLALFSPAASTTATSFPKTSPWPLWDEFKKKFLQPDGRIIDWTDHDRTTSEGESYALFFSLVTGDRTTFNNVLSWTRNNLAQGDLAHHLPSWTWGRRPGGGWGVMDVNSASDADCWMAYSLIEGGRIWHKQAYIREGRHLLFLIEKNEVRFLPGYGWALLPGPFGFRMANGTTRLNPSYLPPELLSYFSHVNPGSHWNAIRTAYLSHLSVIDLKGFAPDWFAVTKDGRVIMDPVKGPLGSYDAVRVYLWTSFLPDTDPDKTLLLIHLNGMARTLSESPEPPLYVDALAGWGAGVASPGFSKALKPYIETAKNLRVIGPPLLISIKSQDRISKNRSPVYYDHILSLFGEGFLEGRFSFSKEGTLLLPSLLPH